MPYQKLPCLCFTRFFTCKLKISTGSVQQIFLPENNLPAVRWQILLSDFEMSKIPYENTENCSRASCTLNDVIQSIRNACKAVLP